MILTWGEGDQGGELEVASPDELRIRLEELDRAAAEASAPTIVDITENGDDGPILSVGVGREDSVLVWVEYRDGEPFSMLSKGGRDDERPLVRFSYAGEASGYPPNALIPKEQAWEAARRFFAARSLPDNVSWERV
jgi:Immunity protein Imm1